MPHLKTSPPTNLPLCGLLRRGVNILIRFAACQVPLLGERDLGRGNTNVTSENLTPGPSPQEMGEDAAKIYRMRRPSRHIVVPLP